MEPPDIQPWFFQVEPFEGESISHFLGRFRRENDLTPNGLGKISGLGGAITRWEKFRFNPFPTLQQLEMLSQVIGTSTTRLREMFPQDEGGMKLEPIRLCATCYTQASHHCIEWQYKETKGCNLHKLRLLSECPKCGAKFKIPALWNEGKCYRCFMTFDKMTFHQKSY